jgi:chromate reductase, NAD(P)H dehydrogenase (quinone)
MTYKVGYFVGSQAANSINRKLAKALVRVAPSNLELVEIGYSELPAYDHELDGAYPAVAQALKNDIAAVDAVLFVTPEYNRSIPGALKNAIDWASRPWGTNSFNEKPAATIGTSPGGLSSAVGQQHLKNILDFLNAPSMGQPEGYIQFSEGLITDDGEVTNDATAEFLTSFMASFAAHVERNLGRAAA